MLSLRNVVDMKLTPRWCYGALALALSLWILHSFLQSLLAACVTAAASWPLYVRFSDHLPQRWGRGVKALLFTLLITTFVLAPLVFAFGALLTEAHTLLLELAAADQQGIAMPAWIERTPIGANWLAREWSAQLARPNALASWLQHANPASILGWAQSLGGFMLHHLFIIGFTILVLFFLYYEGDAIARHMKVVLRHLLGERAEGYCALAASAVRASVNSMLVVALFDGVASGVAYAIAGAPRPVMWGAITGALALVPFLGYAAVIALVLQLSLAHASSVAVVSLVLGCLVLLFGDKILRPVVARNGIHLGFVWVLMGCLGGFEVLGLIGLVIGPVVLTLTRQLWLQHVRDVVREEEGADVQLDGGGRPPLSGQNRDDSLTTSNTRPDNVRGRKPHDRNEAHPGALQVAAAKISATGEVYRLAQLSDFDGNYTAVAAGVAVVGGGAGTAMQNPKGVVIKLRSTTEGIDVRLALEGVTAKVVAE